MYKVYVRHYGEKVQAMEPAFKRKSDAARFMLQQGEIVKGYEKRTGLLEGDFVVFGDEDIIKTRFWVAK